MSQPCKFGGKNEDRILARLGGTNTTNKIQTAVAPLRGQQMDRHLALHNFVDHFAVLCPVSEGTFGLLSFFWG